MKQGLFSIRLSLPQTKNELFGQRVFFKVLSAEDLEMSWCGPTDVTVGFSLGQTLALAEYFAAGVGEFRSDRINGRLRFEDGGDEMQLRALNFDERDGAVVSLTLEECRSIANGLRELAESTIRGSR